MEEDKDRQAFMELRERMEEAKFVYQQVIGQTHAANLRQRRATIMASEIEPLSEVTPMYKNVGKAYFLSTKPEIMKRLEEEAISSGDEMKQLKLRKDHAEKVIKDTESEILELIKQSPAFKEQPAQ